MIVYRMGDYLSERSPYESFAVPGTYPANPWGIYEILGNAEEWTSDWYDNSYYKHSPRKNPLGPGGGTEKVMRGGWSGATFEACWCTCRYGSPPEEKRGGIRVVCEADPKNLPPGEIPSPAVPSTKSPVKSQQVEEVVVNLSDDVKLDLIRVPPGKVVIGSPNNEPGHNSLEEPQVEMEIPSPLYIGKYEVTQAQFELIMRANPSEVKTANRPVHRVLFNEAVEFCKKLTEHERGGGRLSAKEEYRLPLEEEWEYACRAGSTAAYCYGNSPEDLGAYGWHDTRGGPQDVGKKLPNAWGFCDMHGNVWEWTSDNYWRYVSDFRTNPQRKMRTIGGILHIARGGGWNFSAHRCRSAARYGLDMTARYNFVGFRIVRTTTNEK